MNKHEGNLFLSGMLAGSVFAVLVFAALIMLTGCGTARFESVVKPKKTAPVVVVTPVPTPTPTPSPVPCGPVDDPGQSDDPAQNERNRDD